MIISPVVEGGLREAWLRDAIALARIIFDQTGHTLPEKIRATCGWARGGKKTAIGQAWQAECSAAAWDRGTLALARNMLAKYKHTQIGPQAWAIIEGAKP